MVKQKAKSAISKRNYWARLTIYGFDEKNKADVAFFREWIMSVAKEMQRANPNDYAKRFRTTLFNSD